MPRYIDADALDAKLFADGFLGGLNSALNSAPRKRKFTIGEIRGFIQKAPTADVVEVVRCEDCKHYGEGTCAFDTYCFEATEYSFCSYGERKDGES